ncbi:MAG: ferredoxin family protein [Planctomycetota bacterium]
MAGKIIINTERCKGCGLCVGICPKQVIVISRTSNSNGFFPAQTDNSGCTGCAMCAIMCPEAIIEVYRDGPEEVDVVEGPCKQNKPSLVEERA